MRPGIVFCFISIEYPPLANMSPSFFSYPENKVAAEFLIPLPIMLDNALILTRCSWFLPPDRSDRFAMVALVTAVPVVWRDALIGSYGVPIRTATAIRSCSVLPLISKDR
jgi:hypothetical protein